MWVKLLNVDNKNLLFAKNELHQAVQIVAGFPRNFLPKEDNDINASLKWDSKRKWMKTRFFGPKNNIQLALNIKQYQIEILIEEMVFDSISLKGKKGKFIREWIIDKLKGVQVAFNNFDDNLPYSLDSIQYSQEHVFESIDDKASELLTALYQNAWLSFKKYLDEEKITNADINIWPHHFDIAFSIASGTKSTITYGMSPGDENIVEPYFYVSQWPFIRNLQISDLTPIVGSWQTENWTGLLLRVNEFTLENEHLEERIILDFIKNASLLIQKIAV